MYHSLPFPSTITNTPKQTFQDALFFPGILPFIFSRASHGNSTTFVQLLLQRPCGRDAWVVCLRQVLPWEFHLPQERRPQGEPSSPQKKPWEVTSNKGKGVIVLDPRLLLWIVRPWEAIYNLLRRPHRSWELTWGLWATFIPQAPSEWAEFPGPMVGAGPFRVKFSQGFQQKSVWTWCGHFRFQRLWAGSRENPLATIRNEANPGREVAAGPGAPGSKNLNKN